MCWGWSIQGSKGGGYRGLYMNLGGEGVPGWWGIWVGEGRGRVLGGNVLGANGGGYRDLYMNLGGEGMPASWPASWGVEKGVHQTCFGPRVIGEPGKRGLP